jgi:hypothetical protein
MKIRFAQHEVRLLHDAPDRLVTGLGVVVGVTGLALGVSARPALTAFTERSYDHVPWRGAHASR